MSARVRPRQYVQAGGAGGAEPVGLAAVSAVWADHDMEARDVPPAPLDAGGAADGAGAAVLVLELPAQLFRAVGAAGAGQLVRARGAAVRH